MAISRLSIENIKDDLFRAELYKEVRAGGADWGTHTITLDEVLMPELISQRKYGTQELKWLVAIAAGLDDWAERLPEGVDLKLPPVRWVRERIKYYQELEAGATAQVSAV